MGEEKRRAPRIPVDFEAKFTFENQERGAHALNLSHEGMFLKTDYMLLQNEIVELYFHLPGTKKPFWVKAKVVWGTWIEGKSLPISGMGLQFLDLLPEQKETLDRYLQTLLKSGS